MWVNFDPYSFGVSVGYIFMTAMVVKIARVILIQVISSKYHSLLLEFLATFELLATCFEFGVVIERHGFLAYTGLMLIMFNYWANTWQSASAAPHPHILDIIEGKAHAKTAFSKILCQILAASLVYSFYVKPIWSFGYRSTHLQRVRDSRCFTHLQVPVPVGIFVEALATLSFMVALKIFGPKKYNFVSLPLILVSIVYTGMTYTGCYFNPILASTIQFGCEGISWKDHLLVYWLGPVLGSIGFKFVSKLMDSSPFDNNNRKLK